MLTNSSNLFLISNHPLQNPTAVCQNPPAVGLDASGQAFITPADITSGSSDTCGIASETLDKTSFTCSDVGSNPVTLTVTDVNGNAATCSSTVTVVNDPPIVTPIHSTAVFVDGAAGTPAGNGEFSVTATDPEGQMVSYSWSTTCTGGTFDSTTTPSVKLSVAAGTEPAICSVSFQVCDVCGACTSEQITVSVVDPAAGSVKGGATIQSPAGSLVSDPAFAGEAIIEFDSKYKGGASTPSGETTFTLSSSGFNFVSTTYEWLVVTNAAQCAKYKGEGTLNGETGYGFVLTACDNDKPGIGEDTYRMQISNKNAKHALVYDNLSNSPSNNNLYGGTLLSGGDIQIKKSKKNNKAGKNKKKRNLRG